MAYTDNIVRRAKLKRLSTDDESANTFTMTLDNVGVYAAHWLSTAPALVASDKETTVSSVESRIASRWLRSSFAK